MIVNRAGRGGFTKLLSINGPSKTYQLNTPGLESLNNCLSEGSIMSAVTESNIVSQPAYDVKSRIDDAVTSGRITDPQSGNRGSNQPFTRLNEARVDKYYPHLVIASNVPLGETMGLPGDNHRNFVHVDITVVANNTKDLDTITDEVIHEMLDSRTTFNSYGMKKPRDYTQGISPIMREDNEVRRTATFRFKVYTVT